MNVDHPAQVKTDVSSAIGNLKEIVTIISGLATANLVLRLMELTGGRTSTSDSFQFGLRWPPQTPSVLFLILVTFLLRFYYGNVRHLDHLYDTHQIGKGLAAAFALVILASSSRPIS